MPGTIGFDRATLLRGVAAVLATGMVTGCATADKTVAAKPAASGMSAGMTGMNAGATSTTGKSTSVNGIKPVPTQPLASATWQGMKIQAQAMTAVPFYVFNGTTEQKINPPKHTSFHLMVMLNDSHTGVAIPYASVWATIRKAGKVVYDERMWPMISAYMGPHYGNNVRLPGAGTYQMSLLVSPPVSARHIEYQNVWLHPHRANVTFNWKPGL
jgi:uncharacterized protein involved in high-affinity Fe2+ transport